MNATPDVGDPESRWPATVGLLAAGSLYAALPASLTIGPRWLVPAIVGVLVITAIITHRRGNHRANILVGHAMSGILTLFMLWSLALLILALPSKKEAPAALLRSAALLWWTNVLVFALWYWRLDGGGPHARGLRAGHTDGAFLFPQMTLNQNQLEQGAQRPWSPRFIDYMFLAFNTSTALSPTDAPILSRWAKLLVMTQASISLTIIVILVGRGVNTL